MAIGDFQYNGSYITGGIITADRIVTAEDNAMQFEMLSLTIATAAIALGLNKKQATEFGQRAYGLTRGLSIELKYEALIRLAYEIKERDANG